MIKNKSFKPKAHILTLLGEELIKSPVMAIYELVKNSYDADAKSIDIRFDHVELPENTSISILDDGIGMTEDIIENVWLEPGTDFRKPVNSNGKRTTTISKYYKRVPMGEKGIGRFAVHKLSNQIKLVTRPLLSGNFNEKTLSIDNKVLADYEIELNIDWTDFGQHKYLEDVDIKWTINRNPSTFYFKDSNGTLITLENLKEAWTRGMARNLFRSTFSMSSGKDSNSIFNINLDFKNKWLDNIPLVTEILDDAPFKFSAKIDKDFNLSYLYSFHLKNQDKIGQRRIVKKDSDGLNLKGIIEERFLDKLKEENLDEKRQVSILEAFRNNDTGIGDIKIELYSYNLDDISLKDSLRSSNVKKILKENAGIKVYKDNMRVFNYGDPGNDWLGLDIRRINSKDFISNNQNIGYITLNASESMSLIEKTNREGFIEDYSYELFRAIILEILQEFSAARWADRQKWLKFNKKVNFNPVEDELDDLQVFVEKIKFPNKKDKDYIQDKIRSFKKDYQDQRSTLLIPAGIGMTASVAMHEIEKLVPRMETNVNIKPVPITLLKDNVIELKQYVSGIMTILRKNTSQVINVSDCLKKAFTNYDLKMSARNIAFDINVSPNLDLKCDKRLFITMIMNLIDNSIHWLSSIYRNGKKILIDAVEIGDKVHIVFSDNGPGFREEDSVSDLVKPYFTRRSDGIGIGLYLVDTIMIQHGRLNLYHDKDELDVVSLNKEMDGAIIELVFNK